MITNGTQLLVRTQQSEGGVAPACGEGRTFSAQQAAPPFPPPPSQVTCNSGAKVVQCINQTGRVWSIGDVITVSVKRAQPRSKVAAGQVRAGIGGGCCVPAVPPVCVLAKHTHARMRAWMWGKRGARGDARPTKKHRPHPPPPTPSPFPTPPPFTPGPQSRHHGNRQRAATPRRVRPALRPQRVRAAEREAAADRDARAGVCDARTASARVDEGAVVDGPRAVRKKSCSSEGSVRLFLSVFFFFHLHAPPPPHAGHAVPCRPVRAGRGHGGGPAADEPGQEGGRGRGAGAAKAAAGAGVRESPFVCVGACV